MKLNVIIRKGEKQYVALCPELNVVSQGYTIEEAIINVKEAIELYIEEMGIPEEIENQDMILVSIEIPDNNAKTSEIVG
ncbi:type II toxin-antitoxin system HicB family antitoxin [Candidatus Pacearchaeota archaeon]|nr:type II toxin-antitoxin system HicB family antitoxin [Candidatus Pacearchaeota archaeon]